MSKILKNIKSPVVLIEHYSGTKALYIKGQLVVQSEYIELKEIIQHCLDNKSNIVKVNSDHEISISGIFPKTFDDFFDMDINVESYYTA